MSQVGNTAVLLRHCHLLQSFTKDLDRGDAPLWIFAPAGDTAMWELQTTISPRWYVSCSSSDFATDVHYPASAPEPTHSTSLTL